MCWSLEEDRRGDASNQNPTDENENLEQEGVVGGADEFNDEPDHTEHQSTEQKCQNTGGPFVNIRFCVAFCHDLSNLEGRVFLAFAAGVSFYDNDLSARWGAIVLLLRSLFLSHPG